MVRNAKRLVSGAGPWVETGPGRAVAARALLGAALLAGPGLGWAATCTGDFSEKVVLDWSAVTLTPAPTGGQDYTGSLTIPATQGTIRVAVALTSSTTTSRLVSPTPHVCVDPPTLGTWHPAPEFTARGQWVRLSLSFTNDQNQPLQVKNLELPVYEIDRIEDHRTRDRLVIATTPAASGGTWAESSSVLTGDGTDTVTATNNANTTGAGGCSRTASSPSPKNPLCQATANAGTVTPITGLRVTYNNNWSSVPTQWQQVFFGDIEFCVVPESVPVTVAHLEARQQGPDLVVDWSTTMEKANAGFNLYGLVRGDWTRLNARLIPSHQMDSEGPQHYSTRLPGVTTDQVQIEDLDIRGRARRHGPFAVGVRQGAQAQARPLDLAGIARANALEPGPGPARRAFAAAALTAAGGAGSGRLLVREPGIQRLGFEALVAAGVDLGGVAPARIGLADGARAVPRFVEDANANGVFDAGDAIEFVGAVEPSLYSNANVYVLTSDGTKVLEAASRTPPGRGQVSAGHRGRYAAFPDNRYSASAPPGRIPWYDALIRSSGQAALLKRGFDLPDLAEAPSGGASLEIELWGLSAFPGPDDHHVALSLNGVAIAEARFDGLVAERLQVDLDPALLRPRGNELAIALPGDTGNPFDFVALDGFEVGYPARARTQAGRWSGELEAGGPSRLVDGIGDCDRVHLWGRNGTARPHRVLGVETRLSDRGCALVLPSRPAQPVTYWLAEPGATRAPEVQAEVPAPIKWAKPRTQYLILSHPLFADSLDALVALQQARGLSTEVVTTDAIYAAYSDHQRDAGAIQRFIQASAARPGSRLKYLLIVGGDTPDYFNVLGAEPLSLVPTRYTQVGDLINFAPTDVPYGDLDGDGLPDLPTGRLIARTRAELEAVIGKLVAYRGGRDGVIVTGASDTGAGFLIQHESMSQGLRDGGWVLSDLAVDEMGTPDARAQLLAQLGLGPALVSYLGHSDYDYWDFGPLFQNADVAGLPEGHEPFVVTQWGCWNSYFVATSIETLAHGLLLTPGKGAASLIGSSSLTSLGAHDAIGRRFFAALAQGPIALGDALVQAQRAAAQDAPGLLDDIQAMVLLGDPALVVGR